MSFKVSHPKWRFTAVKTLFIVENTLSTGGFVPGMHKRNSTIVNIFLKSICYSCRALKISTQRKLTSTLVFSQFWSRLSVR